uniref:Uncharacterized protein n=1 Tax=Rhodnius prolixus TaxID=13249 RepID=T1I0L9_RHOPR
MGNITLMLLLLIGEHLASKKLKKEKKTNCKELRPDYKREYDNRVTTTDGGSSESALDMERKYKMCMYILLKVL